MSTHKSNYLLLPSDYAFIEHLRETHEVELTEEDFKEISLFYNKTSQTWERRLANDPNSTWFEIRNGKILGVVAFAVVGLFLAPVLGLGALTGALLGASIGYKLMGGRNNKISATNTTSKDSKASSPTFGFNTAPQVTPIGGVIPIIFTNLFVNPRGGVRTSGVVLHSMVDTYGGTQRLLTIYGLAIGTIREIDESKLLINGQSRDNFFTDDVTTFVRNGTDDQPLLGNLFPHYSQCISVSNNNQLGISKIDKYIGASSSGTSTLFVDQTAFDNFSPSDLYILNGQEFNILAKNYTNNSLTINKVIPVNTNDEIFSLNIIKYSTSKKCSEIQLNLVANLWARDEQNNLLQHGLLFLLDVDGQYICKFLIYAKTDSDIRRRILIRNLPFSTHTIRLYPVNGTNDTNSIFPISDIQQVVVVNTGVILQSKEVQIEFENSPNYSLSVSQINSIVNLNKKQTSNDRGAVIQLTTVNEIVLSNNLGHPNRSNYKGICFGALIAKASNRLQSDPAPSWFVKHGNLGRIHLSAGNADNNSVPFVMSDISASFLDDGITLGKTTIIRNLDKGQEAFITDLSNNLIRSEFDLQWQKGDRYLIYKDNDSLCYFPDIYVWTLTKSRGGLASLMRTNQIADYFIDYTSIVEARKYCVTNNYFWDGIIDQQINWAEWATRESTASLLFPTRIGGKFGLIPEGARNPVALFNASNILPDSYAEEYAPKQKLNCVHVTYTNTTESIFKESTVSIMTTSANSGTESLFSESLKFESITNEHQAIRLGQIFLKSRVLQDRVISFSTALQGFSIREGDFIIVQHLTTEIEKECSGFVLESISYNAGTQKVILSSPSPIGLGIQYSAAIYRLESGSIQQNLICSGIKEGNPSRNIIQIQGLTQALQVPRENYTGDYVIVGKDTVNRRTYRTQEIKPNDDGSVTITAVLWVPEILSTDGLVTIN